MNLPRATSPGVIVKDALPLSMHLGNRSRRECVGRGCRKTGKAEMYTCSCGCMLCAECIESASCPLCPPNAGGGELTHGGGGGGGPEEEENDYP